MTDPQWKMTPAKSRRFAKLGRQLREMGVSFGPPLSPDDGLRIMLDRLRVGRDAGRRLPSAVGWQGRIGAGAPDCCDRLPQFQNIDSPRRTEHRRTLAKQSHSGLLFPTHHGQEAEFTGIPVPASN